MSQFLYALPAVACPIGMGLMMWFMMRSGRKNTTAPPTGSDPREQELVALREEVAGLRAKIMPQPGPKDRERTL